MWAQELTGEKKRSKNIDYSSMILHSDLINLLSLLSFFVLSIMKPWFIHSGRKLQEDLTDEMVGLAKQLKESSLIMSKSLENTEKVHILF